MTSQAFRNVPRTLPVPQATVDLLRHVIHRLKLVQKLRAQMAAADGGGEWGTVVGTRSSAPG